MPEPLIELFPISVSERLADNAQATLLEGDTLETLKTMTDRQRKAGGNVAALQHR